MNKPAALLTDSSSCCIINNFVLGGNGTDSIGAYRVEIGNAREPFLRAQYGICGCVELPVTI